MPLLYLCADPKLQDADPFLKKPFLSMGSASPGAAVLVTVCQGAALPGTLMAWQGLLCGLMVKGEVQMNGEPAFS